MITYTLGLPKHFPRQFNVTDQDDVLMRRISAIVEADNDQQYHGREHRLCANQEDLLKQVLSRPTEQTYTRLWSRITGFSPKDLLHTAKVLTGGKAQLREESSLTQAIGEHQTVKYKYHDPEFVYDCLQEKIYRAPDLYRGMMIYGILITSHILTDGNGRVARAVMQAQITKSMACSGPSLPLNLAFYSHKETVLQISRDLSVKSDWNSFFTKVKYLIHVACDLAEKDQH